MKADPPDVGSTRPSHVIWMRIEVLTYLMKQSIILPSFTYIDSKKVDQREITQFFKTTPIRFKSVRLTHVTHAFLSESDFTIYELRQAKRDLRDKILENGFLLVY